MEPRLTSIPAAFLQTDTGQPFTECLMCRQPLDDQDNGYLIEKAIRNYPSLGGREIIFEYAMCLSCAMKMRTELSEESRSRIDRYFLTNLNLSERKKELAENESPNVDQWISTCIIKGTPVTTSSEYSIYAHCMGNQLLYSDLPYALSGEAMDEVMQLLSNKSLDLLDDFVGNHFGGPPEVMEILKRRPVLI
jgi:hypothetical protein